MQHRNFAGNGRGLIMSLSAVLAAYVLALVGGCGGSSGGNGGSSNSNGNNSPASAEKVQTFGSLTTRSIGTGQPPVVSTTTAAAITALAGAFFNQIVGVLPAPPQVIWSGDRSGAYQILIRNADGSAKEVKKTTSVQGTGNDSVTPAWSPKGDKIAWYRKGKNHRQNFDRTVARSDFQ